MEPANEETGLVPRPSSSRSSASNPRRPESPTAAASSSDGVNGPQARSNPPHASPKDRPVSGIVPPYWTHSRNASRASQASLDRFPAITLEDHTEDPNSETSRGLWARSVSVNDHVVVQGKTGIGSYVVWNCTIQTLEIVNLHWQGGPITIRMRYSEFDDLRNQLVASFPHAKNALPALPPKSVLCASRSTCMSQPQTQNTSNLPLQTNFVPRSSNPDELV
ncbi:uncharacterized protein KD926_008483 [Aspergillus affinis]|uniref:uncharacterized protein n=1 Tax=Aspergillus affinis TaxID=1070780 RepID=UPI0022FE886C|nr:Phox-like protein [Aspergillus affinis]KAI9040160.1 Phox-like protein [Aspergillus affinis]